MATQEHPMQSLAAFIPDGSFEQVVQYIHQYKVHLTVTRRRKSVLGDYRHASWLNNHKISVNGSLNKYEFLITLLHELAHLLTFEEFGRRAAAHGIEWKKNYSKLLIDFLHHFPTDIQEALQKSIKNPAATANGETDLILALRKYNHTPQNNAVTVAELTTGSFFAMADGRIFCMNKKRRTRYECVEVKTGKLYLFSALAEVYAVSLK